MAASDPIPDLLKAVNDASGKAFALWVTFLTVMIYLAVAVGTTTHVQLLLGGPVKLPLLGVDMPLFTFYEVTPPLFVVLHLYVLVQLYLLARSLRVFDDQLRTTYMVSADRRIVRTQLDKFVFTQLLMSAPDSKIILGFLYIVVWLSFVVGPILLLFGFQLQFLPYHSVPVTDVHRIVLLVDIVLLWLLWPQIACGGAPRAWLAGRRHLLWRLALGLRLLALSLWLGALSLVSAALVLGSAYIVTIPGEKLDTGHWWVVGIGNIYPPNRLEIPSSAQLVEPDRDKLSKLDRTISLRGRDLRGAWLRGADLRKSELVDANLSNADLHGANLSNAELNSANLHYAELGSADLSNAKLHSADLTKANLFSANLSNAELDSADLSNAYLNTARLDSASLIATDLSNAELHGANLSNAELDGANLSNAKLRGANLSNAELSNADLSNADLSNVNLSNANLDSANLSNVDLTTTENISQAQVADACGDEHTKLPAGLTIKSCPKEPATEPPPALPTK